MGKLTLHMPEEIERQLGRCRASFQEKIRRKLQEIVDAGIVPASSRKPAGPTSGPPLRFYVSEGYQVSYRVNPINRTVSVLKLRAVSD